MYVMTILLIGNSLLLCMSVYHVKVTQSCLILCNTMDCPILSRPETGVGSLSPFQRIFPTQGSNPGLLHAHGFFTS